METEHFKSSLRRGFPRQMPSEFIVIDGWSSPFIRECTLWAIEQGYIIHDPKTSADESDSQYTALVYRLTDKGRNELFSNTKLGVK